MKSKILKILGVGLTLGMVFSLVAGMLPVAAADDDDYNDNEWSLFEYPLEGEDGDWFRQAPGDPIMMIGPMAQATNGDIYTYVWIDEDEDCCHDTGYDTTFGEDKIFKSTDGGRTWAETGYSDPEVITICCPDDGEMTPGAVIDMVCSPEDPDTIFVTDGWYVYMSDTGGDEWETIGAASLEEEIMGDCDCCITEAMEPWLGGDYIRPITCLDVGYEDDSAFIFIGTVQHYSDCWDEVPYDDDSGGIVSGSVYYISLDAFPSDWTDLQLDCYEDEDDEGPYNCFRIGCQPDFDDEKRIFILASGTGVVGCEEFPAVDGTSVTKGTCQTKILYTEGTPCAWTEFNELFQDCNVNNNFAVGRYVEECFDGCVEDDVGRFYAGSRFAWPDDWERDEFFCFKHRRTVLNDNTISFGGHYLQIPAGADRISYARARVDVYQRLDGNLAICYKGDTLVVYEPANKQDPVRVRKFTPAVPYQPPKEQLRPEVEKSTSKKRKSAYKPPADHPWRRSYKSRKSYHSR